MISVELPLKRTKLVQAYHRWFADKPLASDSYKLVYHYHCKHLGPLKGVTRERKFTKLLDISIDEDKLMAAFGKTTRYEVRRAGNSDELQFGLVSNWETFLKYYNGFAALKEMPEMDPTILRSYWPHCVVTEACFEGQPLVMHTYVVDPVASRINLTYSATHFRGEVDRELRRKQGRANRWLHHQDMLHFKREGYACYDFGGYAFETTDKSLQAVNEFKDSFGGELVEESNYTSRALGWLRWVKSLR
jgi:hypothetical protein